MQLKSEKQYLIQCFLVVLIAYLPISLFFLGVKNDFFTAYFPLKHFFSSSLQSGVFPLWNPFLNYGFPIYGDISEAWWNPGTWLIAITTGYNVWSFTAELIIYLLIAVWGMFTLTRRWISNPRFRQIAACSYACCGFFVGHLQHFNWISAAAVLPVCIHVILKYNDSGKLKYLAASAFSLTWFISAAHPGLIIGALLFILPLIFNEAVSKKALLKTSFYILILTISCSAGLLYGYAEILPYTNRSGSVRELITSEGSTTIASWISFLFSLPIVKGDWFSNDISLRNCFIGLTVFVGLVLVPFRKTDSKAFYFLVVGCIFLLLSSDLIIPLYKNIPLLNFIRLNGELRLFSLLSFILSGTIAIEKAWGSKDQLLIRILGLLRLLMGISFMAALIMSLSQDIPSPNFNGDGIIQKTKTLIDTLQFPHLLMIHSLIQFVVCSFLINATKQGNEKRLLTTIMAELIIAALLNLPFTGVGQRSLRELDSIFALSPKGISAPVLKAEKDVVLTYPKTKQITGDWALMSKQIAQDSIVSYPLIFTQTMKFMESPMKSELMEKPPFFLQSGDQNAGLSPITYRYTEMSFNIDLIRPDTLIIKQNYVKGWQAINNGKPLEFVKSAHGFIAIPLGKNKNELAIRFDNKPIRTLLIYQFIMLALMLVLYFVGRRANA